MSARAFQEAVGIWRIVVTANGTQRCPIFGFIAGDDVTPAITVTANLANEADRETVLGKFPEADRDTVAPALRRLAATVAAFHAGGERESDSTQAFEDTEPAEYAQDGAVLIEELCRHFGRYVVLPPYAMEAAALYALSTFAIGEGYFGTTGYLLVQGPTRESGKTTFQATIEAVAYKPVRADSVTAAVLAYLTHLYRPTLLIDELDSQMSGENSEPVRNILNSGFMISGRRWLMTGQNRDQITCQSTFSAKVLSGINKPGPGMDTVISRCIPIRIHRASAEELSLIEKIQSDKIIGECAPLRRRMKRWIADHEDRLRHHRPAVPPQLSARQGDIWRPLLAIADAIGDAWPQLAREAAVALHRDRIEQTDPGEMILEDIRGVFQANGTDRLASSFIAEELAKMEGRPWPEWRGRPITTTGVAKLLARFDIKPKNVRPPGGSQAKGYDLADFERAFARYLRDENPAHRDVPVPPNRPTATAVAATPSELWDGWDALQGGTDMQPDDPNLPVGKGEAWEGDST